MARQDILLLPFLPLESLFNGIKEDTVDEWQLTADEDKEIPSYLPVKDLPLTNGTQGLN